MPIEKTELVQQNTRVYPDDKEAFAIYCKEHNLKQAEAFAKAVKALELDDVRMQTPGRAAEIEEVQQAADLILSRYADSIRYAAQAEMRISQKYQDLLSSKDQTILELQEKLKAQQEQAKTAQQTLDSANTIRSHAQSEIEGLEQSLQSAHKTIEAKNELIELLKQRLNKAEALAKNADETAGKLSDLEARNQDLFKQVQTQQEQLKSKDLEIQLARLQARQEVSDQFALENSALKDRLQEKTEQLFQLQREIAQLQKQAE